jgi:hypothetical protein
VLYTSHIAVVIVIIIYKYEIVLKKYGKSNT